ncbi:MAG TPA: glutaredoxin family protein [Aggregatilineaceae bacterium]|nr:glutaredoxin family protein [Aggregatilineaceae bacterium]
MPGDPSDGVVVYGTTWCAQTMRVRRFLERNEIAYQFVDVEADQAAANQVRWWTGGFVSTPTIYINGQILVEPQMPELEDALVANGLV